MAVTSLENLKKLSEGQEVELPGWDEEPFICKLKRPSLLGLVEGGQIPNPLLNAAYILFNGAKTQKDVLNLKDQKEILDILLTIKEQTTVLFSTHVLSDVERICTDVAFLNDGVVSIQGKLSDIKTKYRSEEYQLETENTEDAIILLMVPAETMQKHNLK